VRRCNFYNPGGVMRRHVCVFPWQPSCCSRCGEDRIEVGFMSSAKGSVEGARRAVAVLRETVSQFVTERAPRMAAALAFYTTFSLAPLLIIGVAIAGLVFGNAAAEGKLVGEIQWIVGASGAQTIQELVENARQPATGTLAAIFGVLTLLFGATGVVGELQDSLNTIWSVKSTAPGGLMEIVKRRIASFGMVLGIGFLLLVSLILSTAVTALTELAGRQMTIPDAFLQAGDVLLSLLVVTGLFGIIYKVMPDAKIRWRDVWWGAGVAALLFAVGKRALGLYLTHSGLASTYGAAGSLVVLLLWVYYSAQILLFGAELTQVYTTSRRPVAAADGAVKTVRAEKRNPLRLRRGPGPRATEGT
jgi:membrane protein